MIKTEPGIGTLIPCDHLHNIITHFGGKFLCSFPRL